MDDATWLLRERTRRHFFGGCGLGVGSLALGELLRADHSGGDGLRAVANDRARVIPGPLLAAAVAVALAIPFCIVRRILTAKAASF